MSAHHSEKMGLDQQFVLDTVSMDERFLFAKSCFLLWDLLATLSSVLVQCSAKDRHLNEGKGFFLLLFFL